MITLLKQDVTPRADSTTEITFGFCHCGCGHKTSLATESRSERGMIKGQPLKYVNHHGNRQKRAKSRIVIINGNMYRTIPLTKGKEASVDPEEYERLSVDLWVALQAKSGLWYAQRARKAKDGPGPFFIQMHHQVLNVPPETHLDHIDGDGLHNWKRNIRVATQSQNAMNRHNATKSKSGFIGVYPCGNKWQASIKVAGKRTHLGVFDEKEEAARARDKAALRFHGEFARLNFPR